MWTFVIESAVDCGPPPDVVNATYTLSDGTAEGSVATYSCIAGFTLVRNRENSLTCSDNGDWEGAMPRCRGRHIQCTQGTLYTNAGFTTGVVQTLHVCMSLCT